MTPASDISGVPNGAGTASAAALKLAGIGKHFPGIVANRDVTFEVRAGEIHGLLGENGAGKTTLMNIASGLLAPDSGTIDVHGRPAVFRSPLDARRAGIGMVHQHLMLVPNMTVAENVALGLDRKGVLPRARLRSVSARLREISTQYGLEVSPQAEVRSLSLGTRQRVEIVRLLFSGADILILDEPTAVLTPQEWRELATILKGLADEGKAIVFITHKLDELFDVAHRCTVMRDGRVVGTVPIEEADKHSLALMMVGREVVLRVEHAPAESRKPILTVRGLGLRAEDGRERLSGITFEIPGGEILGVAGVDGNGQEELVSVLTGLTQPTSGQIELNGSSVGRLSPKEFAAGGGAVVHGDRHGHGVALDLTLAENLVLTEHSTSRFSRFGWLRRQAILDWSAELMREYDIRAPSPLVLMSQLSGGNQQKAVLARELSRAPVLLVAAQPTRGLDVGAVEFVYTRILEHRDRGGATLLISTELDEILSLADRIAVIFGGRFLRTLDRSEATASTLGLLMAGQEAA